VCQDQEEEMAITMAMAIEMAMAWRTEFENKAFTVCANLSSRQRGVYEIVSWKKRGRRHAWH
jgi:hypothetical protein